MNYTNLGGHSGCQILLYENDDGSYFVRKVSGDKTYNSRLKIQAQKQKDFVSSTVKVPKVLREGYTDEALYYFDMEYIQGITLADYIKILEVGKVRGLVNNIIMNIITVNQTGVKADVSIFQSKIAKLEKKLEGNNNPLIGKALQVLQAHDWKNFLQSSCHGDLTLENIIIKDNEIYLIDFLDSFYDCWILDISTLMQDVQTMWSYRNDKNLNTNTIIRLIVFRDILMDNIKSMAADCYMDVYYALLLKLIRIFPYTKDEFTFQFLCEKTASVLSIIEFQDISEVGI